MLYALYLILLFLCFLFLKITTDLDEAEMFLSPKKSKSQDVGNILIFLLLQPSIAKFTISIF